MTYRDLQSKLHDNPFKPFRIKLATSTVYDVTEPWMIIIGETSAVVVTQVRKDDRGYETAQDWRTISISHILELSDIEMKDRDRKRKPA
jgi:hypothetical protein